jgi:hypothetical protein
MKSNSLLVVVLLLCLAPVARGIQDQGGGGAPPMSGADPTPFEQFVAKLKLDSKGQLPQVEKIFTTSAGEAAPIAQELAKLRAQMVALDGKPDELAKVTTAFTAASGRMVAVELKAFKQVQALLKPNQMSKSGEAFVLIAGIFNPPTPRAPRTMRRGGGGQ